MIRLLFVTLVLVTGAQAQNYTVRSRTIDSGGGESKGGGYTVRGTIGQPDGGKVSTASGYRITGGFWNSGIFLVNIPGAPQMSLVKLADGMVRLSWTGIEGEEWFLQTTGSMKEGEWKEVEDAKSPLDFAPSGKRQFFRLKRRE